MLSRVRTHAPGAPRVFSGAYLAFEGLGHPPREVEKRLVEVRGIPGPNFGDPGHPQSGGRTQLTKTWASRHLNS